MKIHRAALETPNYQFEALGKSKAEALAALHAGLAVHAHQHRPYLEAEWWKRFADDIQITEFELGACYRDREFLARGGR